LTMGPWVGERVPGRCACGVRANPRAPEGKRHAYLRGNRTTVCGLGLDQMQKFADLPFSHELPSVRCPLCARVLSADR